jgi:hypothetical protein
MLTALALTTAMASCAPQGQQARWADPGDPVASHLVDLERQWAESSCTHRLVVQSLLADDFQGTAPSGTRYSKAEAVAFEKASKDDEHDCRLIDARVHFFGDGVALVYGSETGTTRHPDGKDETETLIWTDTWLERGGSWQIVSAQDMRAGCKAP